MHYTQNLLRTLVSRALHATRYTDYPKLTKHSCLPKPYTIHRIPYDLFSILCTSYIKPPIAKLQASVVEGWRQMQPDWQVTVWDNALVRKEFPNQVRFPACKRQMHHCLKTMFPPLQMAFLPLYAMRLLLKNNDVDCLAFRV